MEKLLQALNDHGFCAELFTEDKKLVNRVCDIVGTNHSVGMGGSVTVEQLGLLPLLEEKGNTIFTVDYWPGLPREEVRSKANRADFYLSSANAITQNGMIINTDGVCNRIGSICYGPGAVIFIIGKNKVVQDMQAGIERIRNVAAPKNAVRLGLATPCAKTGKCMDCNTEARMCRGTLLLERPPRNKDVYVLLIDQDYGY